MLQSDAICQLTDKLADIKMHLAYLYSIDLNICPLRKNNKSIHRASKYYYICGKNEISSVNICDFFKGDHYPAPAAISRTYVKTNKRLIRPLSYM